MNLLDRISQDPVFYAIRLLALFALLAFVGFAFAQTEFQVVCSEGICQMRESDLEKLQAIINAMYEKILELQAKGACT
jgi:hypothetical protein